jgi:hypothetical protein
VFRSANAASASPRLNARTNYRRGSAAPLASFGRAAIHRTIIVLKVGEVELSATGCACTGGPGADPHRAVFGEVPTTSPILTPVNRILGRN